VLNYPPIEMSNFIQSRLSFYLMYSVYKITYSENCVTAIHVLNLIKMRSIKTFCVSSSVYIELDKNRVMILLFCLDLLPD